MVGKYMKLVSDTYHTNLSQSSNYECPRQIPIEERNALVQDAKDKNMKIKEGCLLRVGEIER